MTLEERRIELLRIARHTITLLEGDGKVVIDLFDKYNINIQNDYWDFSSTAITIEVETEEEFKNFPTQLFGDLLAICPEGFSRWKNEKAGRVYYSCKTEDGFTIYIRVGPSVCKVQRVTEKVRTETLEESFIFEKDCDPFMLDTKKEEVVSE